MNPRRRHILKLPVLAAVPLIANAQQSVDPRAVASLFMVGFLGSSPQSASARALAQDTDIIVLDEPTTHLDMYHKAYILRLLQKLAKETKSTTYHIDTKSITLV